MDVTATHLMTTIVLHMDVLNSYKDEINKMEVMLERSSNSLESDVVDSQYPLASNKLIETIDLPIGFSELEEDGTYILVTSQNLYTGVDAE